MMLCQVSIPNSKAGGGRPQDLAHIAAHPVHRQGKAAALHKAVGESRHGRQMPEGGGGGHDGHAAQHHQVPRSHPDHQPADPENTHAEGHDQAPVPLEQIHRHPSGQVDDAGHDFLHRGNGGGLQIGEGEGLPYVGKQYQQAVLEGVEQRVGAGDPRQDKAALPSHVPRPAALRVGRVHSGGGWGINPHFSPGRWRHSERPLIFSALLALF